MHILSTRALAAVPADGTTMQPTSDSMIQSAIEKTTVGATGVVAECNLNIGVDFSCSTKQELYTMAQAMAAKVDAAPTVTTATDGMHP